LDIEKINGHWHAYIYDQQENQTDDVELMLSVLGKKPLRILEVCCGTGRILIPLAKAGHDVTGFDMDEDMMSMIPPKAVGLPNVTFYRANALTEDWGDGYDAVVLGGNIMINIVTNSDYKEAQRLFIQKAAKALKTGGHVYLCFDLHAHPEKIFHSTGERTRFHGTDDRGVYGRRINGSGSYDTKTQIASGKGCMEITRPGGQTVIFETEFMKHIPTLAQVHEWLSQNGLIIEQEYGDFQKNPISETTHRTIIYARKN